MWLYLSLEELNTLQEGLNLLMEKTEAELKDNRAKLWAKIQRRKKSDERMQKEKKELDKIFQEKAKELEDENKR